MRSIKSKN